MNIFHVYVQNTKQSYKNLNSALTHAKTNKLSIIKVEEFNSDLDRGSILTLIYEKEQFINTNIHNYY